MSTTHRRIAQMEPWFDEKEADALSAYMRSGGWVTEFKKTEEFEECICQFTGSRYCAIVNNGTVALSVALLALEVSPGDEVIVPDLSMIATANCAKMIGAKPVFVDVEPQTLCLDLDRVAEAVTPRTKAVIHVSFNGRANDLERLKAWCRSRGIGLLEDAAQSLGSYSGGHHLGTVGDLGTFSFSAPKIITTGQGGAVITQDSKLAERVRRIKDFGRQQGGVDIHDTIGFNFKFTDIQAVIGIEQMKKLPSRVDRKKAIYDRYRRQLAGLSDIEWIETDLKTTTPWFIDIFTDAPEKLLAFLKVKGIGSRRIYPPIHSQKAYDRDGFYPVTERYSTRGLWLPSSAFLSDEDIDYTCAAVREFFEVKKERHS